MDDVAAAAFLSPDQDEDTRDVAYTDYSGPVNLCCLCVGAREAQRLGILVSLYDVTIGSSHISLQLKDGTMYVACWRPRNPPAVLGRVRARETGHMTF